MSLRQIAVGVPGRSGEGYVPGTDKSLGGISPGEKGNFPEIFLDFLTLCG